MRFLVTWNRQTAHADSKCLTSLSKNIFNLNFARSPQVYVIRFYRTIFICFINYSYLLGRKSVCNTTFNM